MMKTILTTTALILAASAASADNICYRQMNPLDYSCRYDATRNRCDCREVRHGEGNRPQSTPTPAPEPECKGKCEPKRETDPEGWQDWRDKQDGERSEKGGRGRAASMGGRGNEPGYLHLSRQLRRRLHGRMGGLARA